MASTRLIHHSCTRSHSLAALSAGAERLFWRLVVLTEDHGRFEADLVLIRTSAFPLMLDKVSEADIEGWLGEIEAEKMIQTYEAQNGKRYGHFVNWAKYQTVRAKASRYPGPVSTGEQTQTFVDNRVQSSTSVAVSERFSLAPYSYSDAFLILWNYYPRKQDKKDSRRAWEKLRPNQATFEKILAALEVQKKSDQWTRDSGKYIPLLSTWLHKEKWEDEAQANPGDDWRYGLTPAQILAKDKEGRAGGYRDYDDYMASFKKRGA